KWPGWTESCRDLLERVAELASSVTMSRVEEPVGWVERSEAHRTSTRWASLRSTHPTSSAYDFAQPGHNVAREAELRQGRSQAELGNKKALGNENAPEVRRIFVECTSTFQHDLNGGIQRVVRNIVNSVP